MLAVNRRTKIISGVAGALVVVGGAVVAVQLLTDGGGGPTAAAEVLPADTDEFVFVDRDAWAKRVGLDDIGHDFSDEDLKRYHDQVKQQSAVSTPLASYVSMMKDAAFHEFDVDWQVTGRRTSDEPAHWEVYRIDDDIDLADIADDLTEAGYDKQSLEGHDRFTADLSQADAGSGLIGDQWPAVYGDLTLIEDEHLVIAATDPESVVEVIDGDADSLADSEHLEGLLDPVDDVEVAVVGLDSPCGQPLGRNTDAAQTEAAWAGSGADGLGSAQATGFFLIGDGETAQAVGVLEFASDDDAEDDAKARRTWLEDGSSLITGQPMSELVDLDSVETDGSLVIARADTEAGMRHLDMVNRRDGLTVCRGSD